MQEVSALLLLGIDIGGTKLALSLGDASGTILRRFRRPTDPSGRPGDDIARMAEDARRLLAEAGVSRDAVAAVGISAPGPVDVKRGQLIDPPNLPGWGTVPVAALVEAALGGPVAIENDANAAALAEWRFGAGRGFASVVYLTMSTGIGGGLILDGRLYRGCHSNAGEIGHIPLMEEDVLCACGMRGCFEAAAGGAAWTQRLRRIAPESSEVTALAGGREHVTPEHVVAAARAGDAFARAEFDRWLDVVARGVATIAFTLAPERIILGTIAVAAGEELCFAPLRERLRARVWPVIAEGLEVVPAALGRDIADLAGICAALEAVQG
jgi:glucokinase